MQRPKRSARLTGIGLGITLLGSGSTLGGATWEEKSFVGHTRYRVTVEDGVETIEGEARASASLYYRRQPIDLTRTPVLHWRWKVSTVYGGDFDERTKAGDDYPARLYVAVKTGFFPWQTRAINYVWSSKQPLGATWPNAYTDKTQMVAVAAGADDLGRWRAQQRDVVADFKRYFDLDVTELAGYAVMVDGDNTGNGATAWFTDIHFAAE